MRTVKEIRRANLKYVVDSRYNGIVNRLATACGLHNTQLARVLATGKSRRDLGDKMARLVEETVGLPAGWLDQEHAATDELGGKIAQLDTQSRLAVEAVVDTLLRIPVEKD